MSSRLDNIERLVDIQICPTIAKFRQSILLPKI
jgi:hypothetical protein